MEKDQKRKKTPKNNISKEISDIVDLAHKKSPKTTFGSNIESILKSDAFKKILATQNLTEINQKFNALFYSRMEIIQKFITLFDYCEERRTPDEILILIKEIKVKLEKDFPESSIIEKLKEWIQKLGDICRADTNTLEKISIELELSILDFLSELNRVIYENLKFYEETFAEQKAQLKQLYDLIEEQTPLITSLEKKYSQNILQYLMIIEKNSGISLYEYNFTGSDLDPIIVSGFLTAIQYFGSEIAKEETAITKLAYKNFEIALDEKEKVRGAIILKGTPAESIIKKLEIFVAEFEKRFKNQLENWDKNISYFKKADDLIKRIFE